MGRERRIGFSFLSRASLCAGSYPIHLAADAHACSQGHREDAGAQHVGHSAESSTSNHLCGQGATPCNFRNPSTACESSFLFDQLSVVSSFR